MNVERENEKEKLKENDRIIKKAERRVSEL